MTVEELFISLGFKTDQASIGKVQSEANALKGKLGKLLGAVGVTLSVAGITNFVKETAAIAADVKATNNQFNLTFKGMEKTAASSLRNVSKETGIAESRMKMTYARIASFAKTGGMSAAEANDFTSRSMKALADNAAYMDKSIEYTADTFQKLLKGNFNLDDNLNFNLSQAERDQMAAKMFNAKNYNALDENQKKELILQKLIQANKQMGAENQAKREAGEYTNQIGELSDNIKMLKANIGSMFLPMVLRITTRISGVVQKISDWLGSADDEGTRAYKIVTELDRVMDHLDGYIDKIMTSFDSHKSEIQGFLSNVKNGLGSVWSFIGKVVDSMGGIDNVLQSIAFTWAQFKIVQGIGKVVEKISLIKPLVMSIVSPAGLAAAALLAVFAVIQDIVYFFQGKNSLLGDVLSAKDAEALRKKIQEIVDDAKEIGKAFEDIGKNISSIFQKLFGVDTSGAVTAVIKYVAQALVWITSTAVDLVSTVVNGIEVITDVLTGNKAELGKDVDKVKGNAKEVARDFVESGKKDSESAKELGGYYRNGHFVTNEESERRDAKQKRRQDPRNFRNGTYVGSDVFGGGSYQGRPTASRTNIEALKRLFTQKDAQKKMDAILSNQTANPKVVANNSGNTSNVTQNISFSNVFNGSSEQKQAATLINFQMKDTTKQAAIALAKSK